MTLPRTVPRLNCLLKSYVSRTVPRHNFSWRPTCQGPYQDILTHEVQCLTWPFEDIIIMSHLCSNDRLKKACLTNVAVTVRRYHVSPMLQWPYEVIMSHQCHHGRLKISCLKQSDVSRTNLSLPWLIKSTVSRAFQNIMSNLALYSMF